jgi:hypothetical protein
LKLYITPEAKQKLELYTAAASGEISGLGRAYVHNDDIYVEDIYLLKQECTGSSTDLDPEAVAEFITELIAAGRAPEEIKVFWHSHDNMGCFWSGTDEKTCQSFGNGWMVSIVVNKKGESLSRLDVYDPVHLICDKLELEVTCPPASKEFREMIEAEVKAKVSVKTYNYGGMGFHQGNFQQGGYKPYVSEWERDPRTGEWLKGGKSLEQLSAYDEEEELEWIRAGMGRMY